MTSACPVILSTMARMLLRMSSAGKGEISGIAPHVLHESHKISVARTLDAVLARTPGVQGHVQLSMPCVVVDRARFVAT